MILLGCSLMLSACQSSHSNEESWLELEGEGLTRTLTIELVGLRSGQDKQLYDKIRQYDEERRDVEVEIRQKGNGQNLSPSLLGRSGGEKPPDLIELTPNMMKMAFHHGLLETLNMNESRMRELVITSPDGYVIGVKSKVNPLVVYYHQDIFQKLGLEPPSGDWDWDMLDQTIVALKEAGEHVYINLYLHTLEWVAESRYGGQIVDASGTVFGGYLDSREAVQAAEWLAWVGSRKEDYELPSSNAGPPRYEPFHHLIEGDVALAIDYAYGRRYDRKINYAIIAQSNDSIGIAPLPGGVDTVNVAHTAGLAIPSGSPNADIAMELLRYLTEDVEAYYDEIATYTLQADSDETVQDPAGYAVVLGEIKRSRPSSLLFYEDQHHGRNDRFFHMGEEVMSGQPAAALLERYASRFDEQFKLFQKDFLNYSQCIEQPSSLCNW